MNEELAAILMDLNELCEANANAIEQVLMLAGAMPQPEKEKQLAVLKSIQIAQDGCKKTRARIQAMRSGVSV
jgi:hypothetical protein